MVPVVAVIIGLTLPRSVSIPWLLVLVVLMSLSCRLLVGMLCPLVLDSAATTESDFYRSATRVVAPLILVLLALAVMARLLR